MRRLKRLQGRPHSVFAVRKKRRFVEDQFGGRVARRTAGGTPALLLRQELRHAFVGRY